MPFCPEKGQKGAKVGGAVEKNQLFGILFMPQTPFFRKNLIFSKMGKKGPKWPKNRVVGLLCKIESLVFARNDLK